MGRVIPFPSRLGAGLPQPPAPAEPLPPLPISEDAPGTPEEEFAMGLRVGTELAHYDLTREELLELAAASVEGPTAFLRRLRHCGVIQGNRAAANVPLSVLTAFLYGRYGGGVGGWYAAGHRAGILMVAPFAISLH